MASPRFLPSDVWVRALLAPVFIFILAAIDRNYQTDLWHHLARGRIIVEEGQLLNHDRFTYTVEGQPFLDVNWLSQVMLYSIYRVGGLELLQTANALVLALLMGCLAVLCQRRSGSWLVTAGVSLFTLVGLWQFLLIRPQTFSLLLFVLLYLALEAADRRRSWLLLVPVIPALWVNVHGAFPVALLLIGIYWLAAVVEAFPEHGWRQWRSRAVVSLTLCLLASALATLVNPYGWDVYEYVVRTSGLGAARRIDEWLPPGLHLLAGKVWVLSLLGLLVLFALPGRRPTVREVCLVLGFLPLACGSVRMIVWWLLILAPILASLLAANLSPAVRKPENEATPTLAASLTCLVLLTAALLAWPGLQRSSPYFLAGRSPHRVEADLQEIVDRLRTEAPGGRVFTRFEWSEYLTWELGPAFPVFMDGRLEIFPANIWADYSAITAGKAGWQKLLDQYHVDFLLVDAGPYHGALRPLVEAPSSGWEPLQQSGDVILYRRLPSRPTP